MEPAGILSAQVIQLLNSLFDPARLARTALIPDSLFRPLGFGDGAGRRCSARRGYGNHQGRRHQVWRTAQQTGGAAKTAGGLQQAQGALRWHGTGNHDR